MCNRRVTGEVLGEGVSRIVYEMMYPSADGKAKVLKVAKRDGAVNLMEKAVWDAVKGTSYEKYFMPVLWCSEDGKQLQMYRAPYTVLQNHISSCQDGENCYHGSDTMIDPELKAAMSFLGIEDVHRSNVVLWNGRQVIIDYSPPWGVGINELKRLAEGASWN